VSAEEYDYAAHRPCDSWDCDPPMPAHCAVCVEDWPCPDAPADPGADTPGGTDG
jgi:hypothetical protein